jgi:hypothetical protein
MLIMHFHIMTEYDFQDGRSAIFVRFKIDSENSVAMGIYDHLYFQDIFTEKRLKECIEESKKIWNQEREMCQLC